MALSPEKHYVNTSTLAAINALKIKQLVRFKKMYDVLPDRFAVCLLGDVQQHVSWFIYSQSKETKNLESFRWMLAVESVDSAWFPAIVSATTKTTIEAHSTCVASYKLASCCLAAAPQIEAAPPDFDCKIVFSSVF